MAQSDDRMQNSSYGAGYVKSAMKPFLAWIALIGLSFAGTFIGFSMEIPVVVTMAVTVMWSTARDRSGMKVLLFLIVAWMIGVFSIRYQVGYGLISSTSLFNTTIYLLVLFAIAVQWFRTPKKPSGGPFLAALIYVCIAVLAMVFSPEPIAATRRHVFSTTFTYLMFLLAYLVSLHVSREKLVPHLLTVFVLCGLADGLYGAHQYINGLPEYELAAFEAMEVEEFVVITPEFIKIIGLSGSAYGLFYNLAFFTVCLVPLLRFHESTVRKFGVLTIIVSLVVLSSFTERIAVVLTLLAGITVFALHRARGVPRRVPRIVLAFGFLIVALIPVVTTILTTYFSDETLKLARMQELATPTEAATMVWRFTVWQDGVDKIWSSLLAGDGYQGEFGYHMEYLNVLLTFGAVGFAIWIGFLTGLARSVWKMSFGRTLSQADRATAISLFAFFVALAFAAIPNNPFTYPCGLLLFVLAAPFCAGVRQERNRV